MAMMAAEIADIIRNSVSAVEVGRDLGLNPDSSGRCRCPFHNGHDRNMKLYGTGRGFYCFVCHEHGDCIKLAKQMLPGMTFRDIAEWFNENYNLGMSIGGHQKSYRYRASIAARYSTKAGVKSAGT